MLSLCEFYVSVFTKNKSICSSDIKFSGERINFSNFVTTRFIYINELYFNTVIYKLKLT